MEGNNNINSTNLSEEENGTFNIKKEYSEKDQSTVSIPDNPREDNGMLNVKVESGQDFPVIPLTLMTNLSDQPQENIDTDCLTFPTTTMSCIDNPVDSGAFSVKVEGSEANCLTETSMSICTDEPEDTDTVDIKMETSQRDCSAVSITPVMSKMLWVDNPVDIGTVDVKVDKDCPTDPITPIISCVDTPEDTSIRVVKTESIEENCSMVLSNPNTLLPDKPREDAGANKCATLLSTPHIILPHSLEEDIENFQVNVKFAKDDCSTVPSAPKTYPPGPKNDPRLLKNNSMKPTNNKSQAFSKLTVPSISKKSVPIQKKVSVSPSKKKLSKWCKKKKNALIGCGVTEDMAKKICLLPIPTLIAMFPSYRHVLGTVKSKQGSQTPITNAPGSASTGADSDKACCLEPIQKDMLTGKTNEQSVNFKSTIPLRVGNPNEDTECSKPSKKKLTFNCKRRRRLNALIALGVTEDMAKKLSLLPIPSLITIFPNIRHVLDKKFKPGPKRPVMNASGSASIGADKASCLQPTHKNQASKTNEQQSANITIPLRALIPNEDTECCKPSKNKVINKCKIPVMNALGLASIGADKASCLQPTHKNQASKTNEQQPADMSTIPLRAGIPNEDTECSKPSKNKVINKCRIPVMNASGSASIGADKASCLKPTHKKQPASKTNEQQSADMSTIPLRVGIQNAKPMDKSQMSMIHRHLVSELKKNSGGPEFSNFNHMDGWVMVTCVDQRSRAWLVEKIKYLDLWPGAQLSIMPEQKMRSQSVTKVIAYIPESEATNVQEALSLLKAQNNLNTERWRILNERLIVDKSWSVLFTIDEPSLKTLRAQNYQAAIGFKRIRFKVVAVAREASNNSKPQLATNQDQSISQGSKGTNQKPPFTSDAALEIAAETSTSAHTVESQGLILRDESQSAQCEKRTALFKRAESSHVKTVNKNTDGEKKSYINNIRPTPSKEVTTLVGTGRPMPQTREDIRSDIGNSGSKNVKGPGSDKPKTLEYIKDKNEEEMQRIQTKEHIIHSAMDRIEKLRQKSKGAGKWDEPPTRIVRNRPQEATNRDNTIGLSRTDNQNKITKTNNNSDRNSREEIDLRTSNNEAQQIYQGSEGVGNRTSGVGPPVAVSLGRGITGDITVTQQIGFPGHTTVPSGYGVPTAVFLGNSCTGTGGMTLVQQNQFYAQNTVGNIAMMPMPPTVIPGYSAHPVVNLATNMVENITITPQSVPIVPQSMVIPSYGIPSMMNPAVTGAGHITVPPQNIFSAQESEIQAMDYFIGPGGGSQFVQNQMISQNSGTAGTVVLAAQQTTPATIYTMDSSSKQYYMNCNQDSQTGMSFDQHNSRNSSVMSIDSNQSASGDSDAGLKGPEEGTYHSWVIQDAESVAAEKMAANSTTRQRSPQTSSRNYGAQMNEDAEHEIPSFAYDNTRSYIDTDTRSLKNRQTQDKYRKTPYDRNRPSTTNRRLSPQGSSGRARSVEVYNYESSPSWEERSDRDRHSRDRTLSPQEGGYSTWVIEEPESYRAGNDKDIPLKLDRTQQTGSNSLYNTWAVQEAERRNIREDGVLDMPSRQERNDYYQHPVGVDADRSYSRREDDDRHSRQERNYFKDPVIQNDNESLYGRREDDDRERPSRHERNDFKDPVIQNDNENLYGRRERDDRYRPLIIERNDYTSPTIKHPKSVCRREEDDWEEPSRQERNSYKGPVIQDARRSLYNRREEDDPVMPSRQKRKDFNPLVREESKRSMCIRKEEGDRYRPLIIERNYYKGPIIEDPKSLHRREDDDRERPPRQERNSYKDPFIEDARRSLYSRREVDDPVMPSRQERNDYKGLSEDAINYISRSRERERLWSSDIIANHSRRSPPRSSYERRTQESPDYKGLREDAKNYRSRSREWDRERLRSPDITTNQSRRSPPRSSYERRTQESTDYKGLREDAINYRSRSREWDRERLRSSDITANQSRRSPPKSSYERQTQESPDYKGLREDAKNYRSRSREWDRERLRSSDITANQSRRTPPRSSYERRTQDFKRDRNREPDWDSRKDQRQREKDRYIRNRRDEQREIGTTKFVTGCSSSLHMLGKFSLC